MSSYSPAVKKLLKKLVKNYHERQATGETNPIVCAAIIGKALSVEEIALVDQATRKLIGQGTTSDASAAVRS